MPHEHPRKMKVSLLTGRSLLLLILNSHQSYYVKIISSLTTFCLPNKNINIKNALSNCVKVNVGSYCSLKTCERALKAKEEGSEGGTREIVGSLGEGGSRDCTSVVHVTCPIVPWENFVNKNRREFGY